MPPSIAQRFARVIGHTKGEFAARQRQRADVVRTNQKALLARLLFCKGCERPMIPTYTAKRWTESSYREALNRRRLRMRPPPIQGRFNGSD